MKRGLLDLILAAGVTLAAGGMVCEFMLGWAAAAAVVTIAAAGVACALLLGWLVCGGRCLLGRHAWRIKTPADYEKFDVEIQYCPRCGLHRRRRFLGSTD